jgi:spore coat polysaccharide biosynthesis protein SpsF
MRYGVANATGMPSDTDAQLLLAAAESAAIGWLDTARDYGSSEQRIGAYLASRRPPPFHVATKLSALRALALDAAPDVAAAATLASVHASLQHLGVDRIETLLLHRFSHCREWGGAVWHTLSGLQERGVICRLGASIQSTDELVLALHEPLIAHLQLPFNVLDWRWRDAEVESLLVERPDVTVHVRSALLQGLLASPAARRWPVVEAGQQDRAVQALRRLSADLGRTDEIDLCIAFVRGQPWVDGVVVGCETVAQVEANAKLFARVPLSASECSAVVDALPRLPVALLNPALWPR